MYYNLTRGSKGNQNVVFPIGIFGDTYAMILQKERFWG